MPLLPRLLHRAAIVLAQVSIGDPVLVRPGLYLPHGQVVIDGYVVIGMNTVISPFVTIGRRGGAPEGALIGRHVAIGTGAKILGPIEIGERARIGANALVTADVPAGVTVVAPRAEPLHGDGRDR